MTEPRCARPRVRDSLEPHVVAGRPRPDPERPGARDTGDGRRVVLDLFDDDGVEDPERRVCEARRERPVGGAQRELDGSQRRRLDPAEEARVALGVAGACRGRPGARARRRARSGRASGSGRPWRATTGSASPAGRRTRRRAGRRGQRRGAGAGRRVRTTVTSSGLLRAAGLSGIGTRAAFEPRLAPGRRVSIMQRHMAAARRRADRLAIHDRRTPVGGGERMSRLRIGALVAAGAILVAACGGSTATTAPASQAPASQAPASEAPASEAPEPAGGGNAQGGRHPRRRHPRRHQPHRPVDHRRRELVLRARADGRDPRHAQAGHRWRDHPVAGRQLDDQRRRPDLRRSSSTPASSSMTAPTSTPLPSRRTSTAG